MWGKGENAGYQHFSFSCHVFKSLLSKSHENQGFCEKLLNHLQTIGYLSDPERRILYKNVVGKGKKAEIQHLFLFLQCFLTFQIQLKPYLKS